MYIKTWDEFQAAAEALYAKNPVKTRYCVKWRSVEGKLVLKVTDDSTCLKYKTRSSIILNRFDAFTFSLMQKMQNRTAPDALPTPTPQKSGSVAAPPTGGNGAGATGRPAVVAAADATATQSSAASAGVKKKKPKKKK